MFTELTIGSESYKLKLNTRSSVQMEKALGRNPMFMLTEIEAGEMPKLNDVLIVLHGMLQKYHHGMSLDKVYDLYDRYVEDGHNMFDLIPVFVEVFQDAGYLPKAGEVVEEKN